MGKLTVTLDRAVLENVKKVVHGTSTMEGIEMLRLDKDPKNNLNFAANTYLDALREIHFLMKQLGIEDQLDQ